MARGERRDKKGAEQKLWNEEKGKMSWSNKKMCLNRYNSEQNHYLIISPNYLCTINKWKIFWSGIFYPSNLRFLRRCDNDRKRHDDSVENAAAEGSGVLESEASPRHCRGGGQYPGSACFKHRDPLVKWDPFQLRHWTVGTSEYVAALSQFRGDNSASYKI